MAFLRAVRARWRGFWRPADLRQDYRLAQQALVRAGMSPEASQEELDDYLEQIRAARTSTPDLLTAGFVAGVGVVLAGLVLFVASVVLAGVVETLIDPGGASSNLDAAAGIPRAPGAVPASTPGEVVIAAGLLIAAVFGAVGAVLALLERARFERQRAPYTFAHRRRARRQNALVELLAWAAMLAPPLLLLAPRLSDASAVPVLFLLALGALLFRSLWRSSFPSLLRALSAYNAAGLAAQVLGVEAAIIERQEEAYYGKGVWRRWRQRFARRVNW